ncbi:MAG: hypothetical protein SGILL_004351, partial [Bacillariaceae sp.]
MGGRKNKRQKVEGKKRPGEKNQSKNRQSKDADPHDASNLASSHKKARTIIVKPQSLVEGLSTEEKCDMIAELSEGILEDPTKAFQPEKDWSKDGANHGEEELKLPPKMQRLLDLARLNKNGNDHYIATLSIMSLLAIFKDILPSYRIRQQTDLEREGRVSRETKALWDYERSLLTYYQQYLKILENTWEQGQTQPSAPSRPAITSMLALCELLKNAYHFNFRSNILTIT